LTGCTPPDCEGFLFSSGQRIFELTLPFPFCPSSLATMTIFSPSALKRIIRTHHTAVSYWCEWHGLILPPLFCCSSFISCFRVRQGNEVGVGIGALCLPKTVRLGGRSYRPSEIASPPSSSEKPTIPPLPTGQRPRPLRKMASPPPAPSEHFLSDFSFPPLVGTFVMVYPDERLFLLISSFLSSGLVPKTSDLA